MIKQAKIKERQIAKRRRLELQTPDAATELIRHFPANKFRGASIGGFWPLPSELDVRPLLSALSEFGFEISLPCCSEKSQPLIFREWAPGDKLQLGPFQVQEPHKEKKKSTPTLVLVPLLAFTPEGQRLGYGGGYYDRTLAELRSLGDVFACGVAYAGQEVSHLPTDEHDQRLDGILTEQYFRAFA